MEQKYMIANLQVENIKKIKAIDITPKKDLVIIEGENKAGKTSIMDSIAYLLGGKSLIPEEPIRQGEKEGMAKATIGDFEVVRKWSNPYTSTLKIKTADGVTPTNPQTWLNEKIGSFALEVAELMSMEKDKRIDVFKRITGLKLDDLKIKYDKIKDDKRLETWKLDGSKKELSTMDGLPAKAETENFDALQEERKKKEKSNIGAEHKARVCQEKRDVIEQWEKGIENKKQLIDELKGKIKLAETDLIQSIDVLKGYNEEYEKEETEWENMAKYDLTEIDERMKKANDAIELQYKYNRKEQLATDVLVMAKNVEKYVEDMEKIKKEKMERIKNNKLPIEGLEFDGEVIRFNGIEFEECSTAERIEIALAVAVEEDPNIRVLLIREGSSLDESAVKRVKKLAKEHNFQIWIETVHSSDSNAIHIEEGEVKDVKQTS